MAWEENSHICLHMQLIAILSRIEVIFYSRLIFIKRNKSFFNSNLYIIFHLDCCYKYYSITLFFQLFAFSVSRYICFG